MMYGGVVVGDGDCVDSFIAASLKCSLRFVWLCPLAMSRW